VPSAHREHFLALASEKEPAAQAAHEVLPSAGWLWPAPQFAQIEEPVSVEYLPATQAVHEAARSPSL